MFGQTSVVSTGVRLWPFNVKGPGMTGDQVFHLN
ncbi:uncharacterized protein FIBRA_09541 [Fibroporia radiculosa]|uniref:Uncharacterized protein n=1 Tax=Fibroporia radiculosa TaxID=599839 RepID=J7RWA2_9APHY|nr:uncharacterized protein FIBRA_09541 [Fibroporia radiculosa]CCM07200.1 predicted protein [Fibroporia radiculosa]